MRYNDNQKRNRLYCFVCGYWKHGVTLNVCLFLYFD